MMHSHAEPQVKYLRAWLLGALLCIASVVISIAWIDRPLALAVHQLHGVRALAGVAHLSAWFIAAGLVLFASLALVVAFGYRGAVAAFVLRCAIAVIVGAEIKDQLKFLFGRTWPESWLRDNPSFIANGVFGFWPLHGGVAYSAFPSGHTTAGFVVLTLLAVRWPRLRLLYVIAGAGLIALLVGGGFHWFSDAIAGAFLGTAIGRVAAALGGREIAASAPAPSSQSRGRRDC